MRIIEKWLNKINNEDMKKCIYNIESYLQNLLMNGIIGVVSGVMHADVVTNEAFLLNCFFLHLFFFVLTLEIRKWDSIPLHLFDFLNE